ncbi:Calnexin [Scheffersomyces xylosifermentans]|uniref:Calnexin n=1 Tax=Scheffersomyces xylosifermentans TaxID=1304137 RepID=UPI00315CEFCF
MIIFSYLVLLSIVAKATSTSEFVPFDKSRLAPSSYFEQFDYKDLANSPWKPSQARKFDEERNEVVYFNGKWAIESSTKNVGYINDKGLVLKSKAKHHAISAKLPQPFNNTDNDLVLQYEIKLQNGLECGGTYIKLLDLQDDYSDFSSATPYQVMFGPDKCGSNNKIHFIIRRENPFNTSHVEEKHLGAAPMSKTGDLSTLYTLILKKNQDFEIRVNGEVAKAGNLIKSPHLMKPALNPPKEIEDPNDTMPSDWDMRVYIRDPNVQRPDDYDIKHGFPTILDPNAVKPDDWDESEPLFIPDPAAKKPEQWNDEEDGEWLAPEIYNPRCKELSGCGEWAPPMIANPQYVGPWIHPKIKNPNYKGEWKPRMIPNPEYYDDNKPSNLNQLVGGLGFELWSMNNDILFDNIYLGHSVKEAEMIGNETFKVKFDLEYANKQATKEKIKNEPVAPPAHFDDLLFGENVSTISSFVLFVKLFALKQYLDIKDTYFEFLRDPIHVITNRPFKFVLYCALFVFAFTIVCGVGSVLLFLISSGGGASHTYEVEEKVTKPSEQAIQSRIETLSDDEYEDEEVIVNVSDAHSSGINGSAGSPVKRKV